MDSHKLSMEEQKQKCNLGWPYVILCRFISVKLTNRADVCVVDSIGMNRSTYHQCSKNKILQLTIVTLEAPPFWRHLPSGGNMTECTHAHIYTLVCDHGVKVNGQVTVAKAPVH